MMFEVVDTHGNVTRYEEHVLQARMEYEEVLKARMEHGSKMNDSNFTPEPGEVWICSENTYESPGYDGKTKTEQILWGGQDKPLIVLYITQDYIHYVQAGEGAEPHTDKLRRRAPWHWLEHFARIWPPAPTWEQLRAERYLAAGVVSTSTHPANWDCAHCQGDASMCGTPESPCFVPAQDEERRIP